MVHGKDIQAFEATLDSSGPGKTDGDAKIATFFYGLVAIALYELSHDTDGYQLAKFVMSYSLLFALLGYYFWYLSDMVRHRLQGLREIILNMRRHESANSPSISYQTYCRNWHVLHQLYPYLHWLTFVPAALAAICAILGVFWLGVFGPSHTMPVPVETLTDIFYAMMIGFVIVIGCSHIGYHTCFIKDEDMEKELQATNIDNTER